MSVTYTRINWEDSPSTQTPINAENLNAMDSAIDDLAGAVNELDGVPGEVEELQTNVDELKNDLSEFPNGNYPQMGAGYANQLVSSLKKEDQTPYNFRAVPYDATLEEVKKIVGGTVVWKQLIQNGNFASGTDNWQANNGTLSAQNGVLTYVRGSNTGSNQIFQFVNTTVNHVLFGSAIVRVSTSTSRTICMRIGDLENTRDYSVTPNTWTEITTIKKANINNPEFNIYGRMSNEWSEGDTVDIKECMCFDLAQMFGTAIADYVYSLETATAGAGVAWLKTHFPKQFDSGYQAYDAGTLKSIGGLTAHKMVGFNQWDEKLTNGYYWGIQDGVITKRAHSERSCSTNLISVMSNTTYYFECPYPYNSVTVDFLIYYCDASGNLLESSNWATPNRTFTTPSGCYKIGLTLSKNITYNHDICINLSDPTKNGTYEPYEAHSYALDSDVVLRGIPKLDTNNQLYYDGDEYLPDGTVNRRYGVVDLGTLGWVKGNRNNADTGNIFYCSFQSAKKASAVVCTKYTLANPYQATWENLSVNTMEIDTGNFVAVCSTEETVVDFKTAVTGVPMLYELATPTTETADPYTTPQIISPDGTEEYVYEDGAFELPVGHSSEYPVNVSGQLDDILDTPSANGTYVLKATVTDGAVTYSWVADA